MPKKIHAIFDGKVFRPQEPVDLIKNGHYILHIELVQEKATPENHKDTKSDPADDLSSLAVKSGIADLAAEHDSYLYGTPKRKEHE